MKFLVAAISEALRHVWYSQPQDRQSVL